ncbi:hypothetical protein RA210_U630002 [Rubrivivax sp. A210]|nr:hypothetical protein RA210_U630002 [Rubrivivax sp. A210]
MHATCFIPGAFYELWAERFECLKLPFIDFEVGHEGTASI